MSGAPQYEQKQQPEDAESGFAAILRMLRLNGYNSATGRVTDQGVESDHREAG